jgi:hypothetical protein
MLSYRQTAGRLVSLHIQALTQEKLQLPTLFIWFLIKYSSETTGNWHGLREGLPTEWMPEPLFNFEGYLASRELTISIQLWAGTLTVPWTRQQLLIL